MKASAELRAVKSSGLYKALRKIVRDHAKTMGGDSRDLAGVVDVLANIRHISDENRLDYAECDHMAYSHYMAERHGE